MKNFRNGQSFSDEVIAPLLEKGQRAFEEDAKKYRAGFEYLTAVDWKNHAGNRHLLKVLVHFYELADPKRFKLSYAYMDYAEAILSVYGAEEYRRKGKDFRPGWGHQMGVLLGLMLDDASLLEMVIAPAHDDGEDLPKERTRAYGHLLGDYTEEDALNRVERLVNAARFFDNKKQIRGNSVKSDVKQLTNPKDFKGLPKRAYQAKYKIPNMKPHNISVKGCDVTSSLAEDAFAPIPAEFDRDARARKLISDYYLLKSAGEHISDRQWYMFAYCADALICRGSIGLEHFDLSDHSDWFEPFAFLE